MTHYLRLALVPVFLLLCLVLGGASAAGFYANLALQLAALPILVWAAAAERSTPLSRSARTALLIVLLGVLLVAVQLVPLPPSIWTGLPGRQSVAEGFVLLGQPLPWMPISLEPYRTIGSALWVLPALGVFCGIAVLGHYRASWLAWVLAATTIVSVAIGALQIAGGERSSWYFYQITNFGAMTGFFANANHLATLLVATVPFLTALYLSASRRGGSLQKSSALLVVLAGTLAVVFVGIAVNASIAGIGLALPVLSASALMFLARRRRLPWWAASGVALVIAAAVVAVFASPYENNLTGKDARVAEDSRYHSFSRTAEAAGDFLPFGSGIGTFAQIYRRYEDPSAVSRYFMNHAHSDYLELALETGLPGILLVLLFLLWWSARTGAIWRSEEPDHYARAATIASGAMLAHSVVDYPLRTVAISAVFAMCCALMSDPRTRARRKERSSSEGQARHLSAD